MSALIRHAVPAVLAAAFCALVVTAWANAATGVVASPGRTAVPLNGAALEPAVGLPALAFDRSDGSSFTTADTRGRTSLFFFGYTHCADVCPLTLAEFGQIRRALEVRPTSRFAAQDAVGRTSSNGLRLGPDLRQTFSAEALGPDADKVDLYFVTVDPARDTPEWMRTYVANFPGVIGLIGSNDEIARAQSAFNVVAERRDLGNGDYTLDHTGATYLVNAASQIQLAYPYGTASDEIVSDLRQLV